jgi:hypothetical protein
MADDDDPPPDLQQFVRAHGGYDKVSAEAWAWWDAQVRAWQERRRLAYGPQPRPRP